MYYFIVIMDNTLGVALPGEAKETSLELANLATSQARRIGTSVLLLQAGVPWNTPLRIYSENSYSWLATTAASI